MRAAGLGRVVSGQLVRMIGVFQYAWKRAGHAWLVEQVGIERQRQHIVFDGQRDFFGRDGEIGAIGDILVGKNGFLGIKGDILVVRQRTRAGFIQAQPEGRPVIHRI